MNILKYFCCTVKFKHNWDSEIIYNWVLWTTRMPDTRAPCQGMEQISLNLLSFQSVKWAQFLDPSQYTLPLVLNLYLCMPNYYCGLLLWSSWMSVLLCVCLLASLFTFSFTTNNTSVAIALFFSFSLIGLHHKRCLWLPQHLDATTAFTYPVCTRYKGMSGRVLLSLQRSPKRHLMGIISGHCWHWFLDPAGN